jgi:hypothetical protein
MMLRMKLVTCAVGAAGLFTLDEGLRWKIVQTQY